MKVLPLHQDEHRLLEMEDQDYEIHHWTIPHISSCKNFMQISDEEYLIDIISFSLLVVLIPVIFTVILCIITYCIYRHNKNRSNRIPTNAPIGMNID